MPLVPVEKPPEGEYETQIVDSLGPTLVPVKNLPKGEYRTEIVDYNPFERKEPSSSLLSDVGKALFTGATQFATSFNRLLGLHKIPFVKEVTVEEPEKVIKKNVEEIQANAKGPVRRFTMDFLTQLGQLAPAIVADTLTGGALKAVAPGVFTGALSKIPKFALGMGMRATGESLWQGEQPAKALLKGSEETALGTLYGSLGVGLRDLPKWVATGVGEEIARKLESGEKVTRKDITDAMAHSTAFWTVFAVGRLGTILGRNRREKALFSKLQEAAQKKDKETVQNVIKEALADPEVTPETKEAIAKTVAPNAKVESSVPEGAIVGVPEAQAKTTEEQVSPEAIAKEQPPELPEIRTKSGKPFKTEAALKAKLKKEGKYSDYERKQVDGGWIGVPREKIPTGIKIPPIEELALRRGIDIKQWQKEAEQQGEEWGQYLAKKRPEIVRQLQEKAAAKNQALQRLLKVQHEVPILQRAKSPVAEKIAKIRSDLEKINARLKEFGVLPKEIPTIEGKPTTPEERLLVTPQETFLEQATRRVGGTPGVREIVPAESIPKDKIIETPIETMGPREVIKSAEQEQEASKIHEGVPKPEVPEEGKVPPEEGGKGVRGGGQEEGKAKTKEGWKNVLIGEPVPEEANIDYGDAGKEHIAKVVDQVNKEFPDYQVKFDGYGDATGYSFTPQKGPLEGATLHFKEKLSVEDVVGRIREQEQKRGVSKFKLTEKPTQESIATNDIKQAISPLQKELNIGKIKIISSEEDVPKEVPSSEAERASGFVHKDTIYLNPKNIGSTEEAVKTVLHEAVGHYGLQKVLGKDYKKTLLSIGKSLNEKTLKPIADRYGYDLNSEDGLRNAAEEYVAGLAEKNKKVGVVRKVFAEIKNALRKLGLNIKWTDSDIYNLLQKSRKAASGKEDTGIEQVKFRKDKEETKIPDDAKKVIIEAYKDNKTKAPLIDKPFLPELDDPTVAKKAIEFLKKGRDSVWFLFTPELLAGEKGKEIEAKLGQAIVKEASANRIAYQALENKIKWWDQVPEKAGIDFMIAIEEPEIRDKILDHMVGGSTAVKKLLLDDMKLIREWFDQVHKAETNVGIAVNYRENYFTHIWDNPEKAREIFKQLKKSLGKDRYTKLREVEKIRYGLAQGLKLKTANPFRVVLLRVMNANRYIPRQELVNYLIKDGTAIPAKGNKVMPDEFTVYSAPDGHDYYIPKSLDKLLENAKMVEGKGKGLWENETVAGSIFRAIMRAKNALIPIKLGFSAFHPVHIALIDFSARRAALIEKLIKEDNPDWQKAMRDIAAVSTGAHHYKAVKEGLRLQKIFKLPDSQLNSLEKQAKQYMIEGGFDPELSEEWKIKASANLERAIRNQTKLGRGFDYVANVLQAMQKPLFELWIPGLKASAYVNECRLLLERRPELANDPVERAKEFTKIKKSVDNRYGELQYKTLFWNKIVKDVGIGSMLSMGWQLGFIREFGGGAVDAAKFIKKAVKGEATKEDITRRMIFSVDYIVQSMLLGALITYLMTGEAPKKLLDYFYPRAGGKNPDGSIARFNTPNYTREFFALSEHMRKEGLISGPLHMLGNKANPFLSVVYHIARNKDYYDVQIRDLDSNTLEQIGQVMQYFLEESLPISYTSYQYGKERMGKKKAAIGSFLGFTPAPAYITQTVGQRMVFDEFDRKRGAGTKTKAESEREKVRRQMKREIRLEGKPSEETIKKAFDTKLLYGPKKMIMAQYKKIAKSAFLPGDISIFKSFDNREQLYLLEKMWKKGLTEDIKRYFRPKVTHAWAYRKFYHDHKDELKKLMKGGK